MFKRLIVLCLTFNVFATHSFENESVNPQVQPFTATYTIIHKSDPVGTATRKLVPLENGLFEYSYHTEINWLIFSDIRTEKSQLTIENGMVSPLHYQYNREGTGRDKNYEWRYDLANNKAYNVIEDQTVSEAFPANLQDPLSYHLQNRLNLINNPKQELFVYPVIKSSGGIKNYVYEFVKEEEIMLPYGLVKAIKLKREVVEKKRVTYVWFAPELNYLLVKLYQAKSGVEQFEAQLNTVTNFNNN
ncbi:DUF3108 domain-containing protein [Thalassotalea ganghwensis]